MPGSLPAQSQQMCSFQDYQQFQYHAQATPTGLKYHTNEVDQHKVKLGGETKHSKESEQWLNQSSTSSCYTALLEEESEDQEHKAGSENTSRALPINREQEPHINQPHQQACDTQDLKNMMKSLFEQM
jgi:hypothetical protein